MMREIKGHFLMLLFLMALGGVLSYFRRFEFGGESFGLSLGEILTVLLAAAVLIVLTYTFARVVAPRGRGWRFVFAGMMGIFMLLSRAGSPRSMEGLRSFYLRVLCALLVLNLAALAVRRLRKHRPGTSGRPV